MIPKLKKWDELTAEQAEQVEKTLRPNEDPENYEYLVEGRGVLAKTLLPMSEEDKDDESET